MSYFPYEDAAEKRKSQTHCVNGHPFSEENTIWDKREQWGKVYLTRRCLACKRATMQRWAEKRNKKSA